METQFKREARAVGMITGMATGALIGALSCYFHYHPLLVLAAAGGTVALGAGVDRLLRLTHTGAEVRKGAARSAGVLLGLVNAVVLVLSLAAAAEGPQFQTTLKTSINVSVDQGDMLTAFVFAAGGLLLIGLPLAGALLAGWGATLYEDRHPQTRIVAPSVAHSRF